MAQLLVRKVEEAVVERLREEAAREKISVEEAHRRILRRALLSENGKKKLSLLEHLAQMPIAAGDDFIFERSKDLDRPLPDLTD